MTGQRDKSDGLDIVITTRTGDLTWLDAWQHELQGLECPWGIVVTRPPGGRPAPLTLPTWLQACTDGKSMSCSVLEVAAPPAAVAQADTALATRVMACCGGRDLALLACRHRRVLFLTEEGCSPLVSVPQHCSNQQVQQQQAAKPLTDHRPAPPGQPLNVLKEHIGNISKPAVPFFFNTLYDPYRTGADFVRG
jgi:hypothetical protein